MSEPWLSAEIAAPRRHEGHRLRLDRRQAMPAHKVGRLWKFQATEVDAWVRSGGAGESDRRRTSNPSRGAPGRSTAIGIAPAPRDHPGRDATAPKP